ncbi:MAG: NADH-quinone oxidoreductase subunit D [Candidatus Eremiobacter antarcticus]|nr:NADH-quinone oxidoreductase subunit D [Candidatus Eremiobacteraeota bacterium]MBC5807033.1 NADH-quinone oxidoreductase subunit D [Candidatus Eremiobacteraeota bacterium]PZR62930.1 MAG: NADH-quinone oxidoreductase subunit D [Candidatus Eremiobacter sp. RRmetagenome_bin22]
MGPQHPSTHGVLRVMLRLDGETVLSAQPEIGFLHTGIEKQAENLFWQQAVTVVDRADYLAPLSNSLCYVLAAEQLLGIDNVPPRARVLRVMFTELTRIASHLVWLGTHCLDLGAQSIFFYAFDMRERILEIMEFVTGARMHQSWFRIGGVALDVPVGFLEKIDDLLARFPQRLTDMRAIVEKNVIIVDRLVGVGKIGQQEAIDWGLTGPPLRATGIAYDVRRAHPYADYETYDFDVPTHDGGDCYSRFVVRLNEMHESWRIIKQARDRFPDGPIAVDDRKIVPPPKREIQHSMEALIHHFKLVSSGFNVPEGHVYQAVESPRGEMGMYVTSAGGNKPWRVRWRPPSFYHTQALMRLAPGNLIADVVAIIGSMDPVFGDVDR